MWFVLIMDGIFLQRCLQRLQRRFFLMKCFGKTGKENAGKNLPYTKGDFYFNSLSFLGRIRLLVGFLQQRELLYST